MRKAPALVLSLLSAGLLFNDSVQAAARVWANTGTDYNAAASWNAGAGPAPGAGDVGQFSAAAVTQPNLTSSLSNAGLYFFGTGTSGYDVTGSAGIVLTLTGVSTSGSGGTSNSSAAAIRADNTSGTNTIDVALSLAPATTTTSVFVQAAGGTLVVNGAISSVAGTNLSLRGGGTIALNNGGNSFTTASIDTAGETLVIGANGALGTGTFSVNSTATLQAGGGARTLANNIVVAGNTTLSGSNAFTFNGTVTSSGSSSRSFNVSNTGGAVFSGTVNLEEVGAPAGRQFTIGGTSAVTINGVVQNGDTNAASLRYNGSSTLTLTNSNTYTGGTLVGGNVTATHDGGLGGGNVTLSAASITLTLQNGAANNYIADTANVNIQFTTDTVALNFTGTDVIGSLTVNNTQQPTGIYGAVGSGAQFELPEFTGSGTFTVLTQIPEPATYMLMGLGLLVCAQQFRRKKS
ncbi:MAG: PEP-CTERM sorting domain-containing protein [Chthoniobacterales bacterium]